MILSRFATFVLTFERVILINAVVNGLWKRFDYLLPQRYSAVAFRPNALMCLLTISVVAVIQAQQKASGGFFPLIDSFSSFFFNEEGVLYRVTPVKDPWC